MATTEAEAFAELLSELKRRSGRSYGVLAAKLHVSTSTLHRYCNGDAVPADFSAAERFGRLCGATGEEFVELHRRWILADEARRRSRSAGPSPTAAAAGAVASAVSAEPAGPSRPAASAGAVGSSGAATSADPAGASRPAASADGVTAERVKISEPAASAEPVDSSDRPGSAEGSVRAEPAGSIGSADRSERSGAAEATVSAERSEWAEPAGSARPAASADGGESADPAESAERSERSRRAETAGSSRLAERSGSAEVAVSAEPAESAERSGRAETAGSSGPAPSAGAAGSSWPAEGSGAADPAAPSAGAAGAGRPGGPALSRRGKRVYVTVAAAAVVVAVVVPALVFGPLNDPSTGRSPTASEVSDGGEPKSPTPSASPSGSPSPGKSPSAQASPSARESAKDKEGGAEAGKGKPPAGVGVPVTVNTRPYAFEDPCTQRYLVDRPAAEVPPPPNEPDAPGWVAALGAVSSGSQYIELALQGTGSETVVLNDMNVRVVGSDAPLAWNDFGTGVGCGGGVTARAFTVDLDAGRPGVEPQGGQRDFPYKVSESDPEVFHVTAKVSARYVSWYLELEWSSGGREGTLRIDDHGKPFRTSGAQGRPSFDYPLGGDSKWEPAAVNDPDQYP